MMDSHSAARPSLPRRVPPDFLRGLVCLRLAGARRLVTVFLRGDLCWADFFLGAGIRHKETRFLRSGQSDR